MGEIEGVKGAWGYPEGGMGAVSEAIASAAREAGVKILLNSHVDKVLLEDARGTGGKKARAVGVQLADGRKLMAKQVNIKSVFLRLLTEIKHFFKLL